MEMEIQIAKPISEEEKRVSRWEIKRVFQLRLIWFQSCFVSRHDSTVYKKKIEKASSMA